MNKERLERVRQAVRERGLDALLIANPTSIYYLTGADIYPFERMWLLLVRADGRDRLFANRLFVFADTGIETLWHTDTDNAPALLAAQLADVCALGVDRDLTAKYLVALLEAKSELQLSLASECVDALRICKDAAEQDAMREASRINDAVCAEALSQLREGMTERELAALVEAGFERAGCEGPSFDTIAAFGSAGADPHHATGTARLRWGDAVLLDMGCRKNGYCSDMTRTCFFGCVSERQREIYGIVREAFLRAKALVRPGVRFCDIDAAARDHITACGYGEYFTHRLGHCIGLLDHEPEDVGAANTNPVRPGMTFSIEPGIYLPGEFGVRIEDLVLVTADGCESLNALSTELTVAQ